MSLSKVRGGIRSIVKQESDKLEKLLKKSISENETEIRVIVDKLTTYKSRLEQLDQQIFETFDVKTQEGELSSEIEKTIAYNDRLLDSITLANVRLSEIVPPRPPSEQVLSDVSSGKKGGDKSTLRLPKLEIAPYAGEPLEWQSFWDSFDSAIHKNKNLTDIDRFNYLRGLLVGDAARVVDGYRLTAANYQTVVDVLTERFGNKQRAIFAHIEAMLAIPESNHDIGKLQATSDACEKHIRSLVALGLSEDTFGQFFAPIMLSKLPKYVKIELYRRNGTQEWSLDNIRSWLKDEIRAREMGDSIGQNACAQDVVLSGRQRGNAQKSTRQSARIKGGTTAALVSNVAKRSPQCAFCNKEHYSDACDVVRDVSSRRAYCQDQHRCFKCLAKGHSVKQCKSKGACAYCRKSSHHRSLCISHFGPKDSQDASRDHASLNAQAKPFVPVASPASQLVVPATVAVASTQCTVLQTALATLCDKGNSVTTTARLLFDTAGSRSFITEKKQKELGLSVINQEWVSISSFQSHKRRTAKFRMVEFVVICRDGTTQLISASVVPTITCPIQKIPMDSSSCPYLQQLPLAEPLVSNPEFVPVDVLIGNDYYYDFVLQDRLKCPNGPLLLNSKLGYIATGRVSSSFSGPETIAVMLSIDSSMEVVSGSHSVDLERYWELEDVGLRDKSTTPSEDESALQVFNSTVVFVDGRYQVRLPWKEEHVELSDNFALAHGRLNSLLRRIRADDNLFQAYTATLGDQVHKGIIESVTRNQDQGGGLVYYMPHHPRITPERSTTKLRIVYDASSKNTRDGLSLNECLYRGPVYLEDLCGILIRFRLHKTALVSDIEKAFWGIGLQESQRDATRFLWVRDASKPPVGSNLVTYRFCRVPFGIVSSPFLLGATITFHLRKTDSRVAQTILRNMYVDNVITGEETTGKAISFYREAKSLFRSASLNLREWYTNDPKVEESFADADRGSDEHPKVLGVHWNPKSDVLHCSYPVTSQGKVPVTKRHILKVTSGVYDPCGWFCPVTVVGKILIQDLWKTGLDWDDTIPIDLRSRWEKALVELQAVLVSSIPRFIGGTDRQNWQLHVFCDASQRAYAAAAYLRCGESSSACNLVFAKTRLAPVRKLLTIPRLELIAVCVGVRLLQFVADQLDFPPGERFIWTDSQCTLGWLKKDHVSTPFVENRLKRLRQSKDIAFRYVVSSSNPADLPTRGCSAARLLKSQLWWHGPAFLHGDPKDWPQHRPLVTQEHKEPAGPTALSEMFVDVSSPIIDSSRFSSFSKVLRTTGWVLRFIGNARKSKATRMIGSLTAEELRTATDHWIRITQRSSYPDLAENKGRLVPHGIGRQLGIFRDSQNILRCCGRIENASLPYDTKYPVLLPANDHFTHLLIMDRHKRSKHSGVGHTLASIRQKYWIPRGRSTVRKVIRSCKICLRNDGPSYQIPAVPPLPISRVQDCRPFEHTGVDHFGPLWIKTDSGRVKVWGCIFTCMVVRAIHLEVVESMSAEHFLLALRRFCSLQGKPTLVVSDNSKTFRSADRTLQMAGKVASQSDPVQDFAADNGIEWKFIIEYAPWMGGFYERLIGVVKQALKRSLSTSCLNLVELMTVFAEVSNIVNTRPLVYVEDEVGFRPLRPVDFLSPLGRDNNLPIVGSVDQSQHHPPGSHDLILKWQRLQNVTKTFWDSWRKHYLVSLRERHTAHKQRSSCSALPTVNSVVQVKDALPRSQWKLGRIETLNQSHDGKARSACIRLASGKKICRPIKLLYPLEIAATEKVEDSPRETPQGELSEREEPVLRQRTDRATAINARERIRVQLAGGSESESECQ